MATNGGCLDLDGRTGSSLPNVNWGPADPSRSLRDPGSFSKVKEALIELLVSLSQTKDREVGRCNCK